MKFFLIISALSIMLICDIYCQDKAFDEGFDQFIEMAMKDWKVPGLAVSVIKDGKVIYEKGYGFSNLETKERVTTQTLFSIASASKSFTATAAAMLVDEKKLEWDSPLVNYFPDFKLFDPAATPRVTISDLMTHRTGIPRQKFFSINTPSDRSDVRYAIQFFEPTTDFRQGFQYFNEGFTIAGDMVAELSGTTWEEFIQTRILDRLGMTETIFSISGLKDKTDYATPYILWDEQPERLDFHNADILGAAGCIISNVKDMSKWVIFNLDKGKNKDEQLISQRNLAVIQSPKIVIPGRPGYNELSFQNYGIGWFIDYYRGFLHVHHAGVLYGFSSQVSFMPSENIGVVILANLNGTKLNEIIEWYIYDMLLGPEQVDWNGRYLKEWSDYKERYKAYMEQLKKDDKTVPTLSEPFEKFIGSYKSKGYGSLNIRLENDTLKVRLLNFDCSLLITGENSFSLYHPVEHSGWPVSFRASPDGKIDTLVVQVNPGVRTINFIRTK